MLKPNLDTRNRKLAGGLVAILIVIAAAAFLVPEVLSSDSPVGPATQTTKKLMWGLAELPDGTSLMPEVRDLGVGTFAYTARWEEIAPDRRPADPTDWRDPAYQWPDYLTNAVSRAESYGMQVSLMLMGTPSWANGGKPFNWAPTDPGDFGDFAEAASYRYPSVDLWAVWGEPNRQPNFQPLTPMTLEQTDPDYELTEAQQVAPRKYAELLDTAYEELKKADPKDLVIGGNTYTSAGEDNIRPYQWIEYMRLPDGSRPRMDMWGHNPWGNSLPDLDDPPSPSGTVQFSDLGRLADALDRADFPGGPLELYLAEWGVPTGFEDLDLLQELDEPTARKWVRAAFEIAEWDRIYTLGWIHLLDTDRNSTGLLTEDGKRKPIYDTYKESG